MGGRQGIQEALEQAALAQSEAAATYHKAARELQEMVQQVHTVTEQRAWYPAGEKLKLSMVRVNL